MYVGSLAKIYLTNIHKGIKLNLGIILTENIIRHRS